MLLLGPAGLPEVACNSFFDSGAQRSEIFWAVYSVSDAKKAKIF